MWPLGLLFNYMIGLVYSMNVRILEVNMFRSQSVNLDYSDISRSIL